MNKVVLPMVLGLGLTLSVGRCNNLSESDDPANDNVSAGKGDISSNHFNNAHRDKVSVEKVEAMAIVIPGSQESTKIYEGMPCEPTLIEFDRKIDMTAFNEAPLDIYKEYGYEGSGILLVTANKKLECATSHYLKVDSPAPPDKNSQIAAKDQCEAARTNGVDVGNQPVIRKIGEPCTISVQRGASGFKLLGSLVAHSDSSGTWCRCGNPTGIMESSYTPH